MFSNLRSLPIIALCVFVGAALPAGQTAFGATDQQQDKAPATDSVPVPVQQLRNFVEVLHRVKTHYVEKLSYEALLENAIQGVLNGLDPHSAYLTPQQHRELSISTSGQYGGLGIVVTMDDGFIRVISPIDDTPAKRAGIQAHDLIIAINGQSVKGLTLMDAVQKMRGKPGTPITLTVIREGKKSPFKVKIERAVIEVASVKSRMLAPGYGYVRISHFSQRTAHGLRQQIRELIEHSGGHLKGLVLDLRNNPGGVLGAAVAVADTFMNNGQIVLIKGRGDDIEHVYTADKGDLINGTPLVVLVNRGSASASEIVAGALQDADRAVIVGQRTFGKGSVQTIIPLQSGAALKLTTARYYTPSGDSIQGEGIIPDVRIPNVKITATESNDVNPFTESDLVGALPGGDEANDKSTGENTAANDGRKRPLAVRDYALYEALNLLKGMHISRQQ